MYIGGPGAPLPPPPPPPTDQNFLDFNRFFLKFWQNVTLALTGGSAPLPLLQLMELVRNAEAKNPWY